MTEPHTIADLLRKQALVDSDATAIAAPGRDAVSYGDLFEHVTRVVAALNGMGVGRGDRVAVVLPNGPEMAVTFLAVASGATAARLNPAYTRGEFDFALRDLAPAAVVLEAGARSAARGAAEAQSIPVLEVAAAGPAGLFDLAGPPRTPPAAPGFGEPEETALVLHTSGTTSRPKRVPLSARNLCTSALSIRDALGLTPADRCLNVMPLFHIHGLVGATLSSVAAGACVWCSPGFLAPEFFGWWTRRRPRGTRRCPPCTRRCWAAPARIARRSDVLRSASSGRLRRRFRSP